MQATATLYSRRNDDLDVNILVAESVAVSSTDALASEAYPCVRRRLGWNLHRRKHNRTQNGNNTCIHVTVAILCTIGIVNIMISMCAA